MGSFVFEGIGTHWEVTIEDALSEAELSGLSHDVQTMVDSFDNYFSRFKADSFVTKLKKRKGLIEVTEEFTELLWIYLPLFHLTKGKVTPLVGELLEQAGYDATYSFKQKTFGSIPPLSEVVEVIDPTHIQLHRPSLFDFGAAGKGFLADKVANLLKQKGYTSFTVDASGDVIRFSRDNTPIQMGLEDPNNPKKVLGTVPLLNKALCGSAGNRRNWGKFHHILDPLSHQSPTDIIATWVIADTGVVADGLSTCLFFVEPSQLLNQFQFEYVILYSNYSVRYSNLFQSTFA